MSFIPKNVCENEKYIPTTKNVTITPAQKVKEKHFLGLICDALSDLVPFVQFKKHENHPWRSVNFSKVAG